MLFHNCNRKDNIKCTPKEYAVMQCHIQACSITTNIMVKRDFTLPELSAMKKVTLDFHVDDSSNKRHDMILGR